MYIQIRNLNSWNFRPALNFQFCPFEPTILHFRIRAEDFRNLTSAEYQVRFCCISKFFIDQHSPSHCSAERTILYDRYFIAQLFSLFFYLCLECFTDWIFFNLLNISKLRKLFIDQFSRSLECCKDQTTYLTSAKYQARICCGSKFFLSTSSLSLSLSLSLCCVEHCVQTRLFPAEENRPQKVIIRINQVRLQPRV